MVVGDIQQLAECTPQQLWGGKDRLLKRLEELRNDTYASRVLNDRGLRLLDVAIVSTLVSLRRLEQEAERCEVSSRRRTGSASSTGA